KRRFWVHLSLAMTGLLWLGHFSTLGATADKEAHQASAGEVLNFALIDHHGRLYELRRAGGKAVVLFFTANDCPVARQSASKIKWSKGRRNPSRPNATWRMRLMTSWKANPSACPKRWRAVASSNSREAARRPLLSPILARSRPSCSASACTVTASAISAPAP